jgi:hypothetical protein
MNMTILILAAVATTVPCVALWAIDQRERLRGRTR